MLIMTPDHPDFGTILHSQLPPGWEKQFSGNVGGTFIVRAETGLLEPASEAEIDEYLYGGEYEEVVNDDLVSTY
jgi:hypothetical protein